MQDRYNRCPNCMQGLPAMDDVCPYCGFGIAEYEEKSNCLKPFTMLQNKYMIGRVIGVGGFGITYIGWDLNLQTYIAIKEYYPESLASRGISDTLTQVIPNESKKDIYDKGLTRYVGEAQNLSKFYQLQGIVSVKDFFYENGTGYIVMEYINGINLKEFLRNAGGKIDEATVLKLMKPVLESLYQIHNSGLIHRDISPDNIMVDKDNKIKLIDFGSARGQSSETDKTYTVILKHGYAPAEQYYAKGNQGPWTDIYSLCATMYKMLTGQIPPNSVERMEQDEYVTPSALGVTISQRTELVLRKGLAVRATDRYQNIGELLGDLYGNNPVENIANNVAQNTVPYGNAGMVANTSTTIRSMHLDVPASGKASKKKSKLLIGGIVGVASLALVIGLVAIFGGKGNSNKTTDTTEATDDPTTEATTEEPESGYSYEAPEAMTDNWKDYIIGIDGNLYKLPMPYDAFVNMGWETNHAPETLAAGQYDDVFFFNDSVELDVAIANFNLSEATVNECFVVGISVSPDYNEIADSSQIELAAGIKWMQSTEEDVKKIYGAPDYRSGGTDHNDNPYTQIAYYGINQDDGLELEFNGDGLLYEINIANAEVPEDYTDEVGEISTTPPEINSYYQAPDGESTDRFDDIITIDNLRIVLPVPVSVFIENGWSIDVQPSDYILSKGSQEIELQKDGNKIKATVENFTSDAILPINGYITFIEVDKTYCSYEAIFPGGLKIGDEQSVVGNMFSDLGDKYVVTDTSVSIYNYIAYYGEDKDVHENVYANSETKQIYLISYGISIDTIEQ